MAATAMDPVDIANILAQELLYQQVKISLEQRDFSNISAEQIANSLRKISELGTN